VFGRFGQYARVKDQVGQLTLLLRTSDEPFWRSLRDALGARGVDATRSQLAASWEEGDDSEFGVVVTDTGTVVEFVWQPSSSSFVEWVPITDWWQASPYRSEVEEALRRLSAGA
jgi:hypothetical protein